MSDEEESGEIPCPPHNYEFTGYREKKVEVEKVEVDSETTSDPKFRDPMEELRNGPTMKTKYKTKYIGTYFCKRCENVKEVEVDEKKE